MEHLSFADIGPIGNIKLCYSRMSKVCGQVAEGDMIGIKKLKIPVKMSLNWQMEICMPELLMEKGTLGREIKHIKYGLLMMPCASREIHHTNRIQSTIYIQVLY